MITSQKEIPIDACIICQDEEKIISKAILNVKPYVANVIIIDGGSKDNTIKIAEDLGCKIYHRKFDFHFAKQRNFGIEKCEKEWILWVDADEYFSNTFLEILPMLVIKPPKDCVAYKIFRKSIFDGELKGEDYQWRLFKKDNCIWVNKIHEDVRITNGKALKLEKQYIMFHEHSMQKQLWSNSLYYNINNNIKTRPADNEGLEYHNDKWVKVKTKRV